jgi:hypothetical protein
MEVNFNNLRKQAAYTLDKLTKKLNNGVLNQTEYGEGLDGERKKGNILVDSREIQKEMDEIRSLILTICSVYEPEDEDFKDVSEEIEKSGGVAVFNENLE